MAGLDDVIPVLLVLAGSLDAPEVDQLGIGRVDLSQDLRIAGRRAKDAYGECSSAARLNEELLGDSAAFRSSESVFPAGVPELQVVG